MPQIYGVANMALPTAAADGAQKQVRVGRYGDQVVNPLWDGKSGLAAEGTYFRGTNPTPGTALTQAVTASFAATTPLLCIRNNESAGGKTIYLDYLALLMTVAPASSTSWQIAVTLDPNARAPTGGTALTMSNCNTGFATASIGTYTFGPTSVAAAVAQRLITNRRVFNAIPVGGHALVINFGNSDIVPGQTMSGSTPIALSMGCGPVAIGPGHTGLIHSWYPSNATTGASYEVELGVWER